MEENKTPTPENISSGADKVKRIENEKKNVKTKQSNERRAAERRTAAAKSKAAEKKDAEISARDKKKMHAEKKLAMREAKAERKALQKERAAERKEERAKRKDMIKNETAVQRLERKAKEKAMRIEAREKARERRKELILSKREARLKKRESKADERKHKRSEKTQRKKQRAPGFGGWLAAVISLGTASLAMAVVITAGAINMSHMSDGMMSGYMSSVYELDGAIDGTQTALSKLRVSSSPSEQARLFSDIVAKSEIMECDLAKIPVDSMTSENVSGFVGRTSAFARSSLSKLASGQPLDEKDYATIAYLYEVNTSIRRELDELCLNMTMHDMSDLIKGGTDGKIYGAMHDWSDATTDTPEEVEGGPFSSSIYEVNAKALSEYSAVSSTDGEELIRKYFKDYGIKSVEYTGEANISGFGCFNYNARDDRGREYFVQLSRNGGKLVMFDSYENCMAKNYNTDACVEIAQKFLSACGIENCTPVFVTESGSTADINFCYTQDGCAIYADMIKLKVCQTRGVVTGMEAFPYWLNHETRDIPDAKISVVEAMQKLEGCDINSARLALIPEGKEEILCYEIDCRYADAEYYVYLDAATGKEVKVYTVQDTDSGKIIA